MGTSPVESLSRQLRLIVRRQNSDIRRYSAGSEELGSEFGEVDNRHNGDFQQAARFT